MLEGKRELCLKTTTSTGCALGVKHSISGKLVEQRWRIASTAKRPEQNHTSHVKEVMNIMKPETVTTLSGFLFVKLWPDGFAGHS